MPRLPILRLPGSQGLCVGGAAVCVVRCLALTHPVHMFVHALCFVMSCLELSQVSLLNNQQLFQTSLIALLM